MKDLRKITPDEIRNDDTTLYIKWKDGAESSFDLLDLRKKCPCAVCRGGHEGNIGDATGHIDSIKLYSWQKIGRYALGFSWNDNHNDGIYTYENLREYADNPAAEVKG